MFVAALAAMRTLLMNRLDAPINNSLLRQILEGYCIALPDSFCTRSARRRCGSIGYEQSPCVCLAHAVFSKGWRVGVCPWCRRKIGYDGVPEGHYAEVTQLLQPP